MVRTKDKTLDDYIAKMETHLLKKYPNLEFEVVKWNNRDATIYYRPYLEDDEFPIVHRIGNIVMDALLDGGYHIYVHPAA